MQKSKLKRILSFLLAIVTLVGIIPPSAFASEQNNFTYGYDIHKPEYDYADYESEYDLADDELKYAYDDYQPEYHPADHDTKKDLADYIPDHIVILKAGSNRALVNDTSIVMDDPAIIQDDIMFIPIESIAEFWDADITFDNTTLTIELDNRRVTLEINSWIMQFWTDGDRQTDIDLRNVLDENLTEQPIRRIDGIPYIAPEAVVVALGFFVRWVSLDGQNFAIITATEITAQEARALAIAAQPRLPVSDDSYITDDDILEQDEEAGAYVPPMQLSAAEPRRFTLLAGSDRAILNSTHIIMTDAATIRDGTDTFFIPVNNIAELTGASVNFANEILTVDIGVQTVQLTVGQQSMRRFNYGSEILPALDFATIRAAGQTAQPLQRISNVAQAPLRVMMADGFGWYVVWVPRGPVGNRTHFAVVSNTPISQNEAEEIVDDDEPKFDPNYIPTMGIGVSPTELELVIDRSVTPALFGQAQLGALVSPNNATNQTVRWESSNSGVVTVTGIHGTAASNIAAVNHGTAVTITAHAADNGHVATSVITVVERASSVTLAVPTRRLTVQGNDRDTYTLTPTVFPAHATNQTVTWTSLDPNVATVNPTTGLITAQNRGTARIVADVAGSAGRVYTVREVEVIRLAERVILNRSALTLHMTGTVGETYTDLTATVEPGDAYNTAIDWSSNNTDVATVDANGNITARGVGQATITATVRGTTISASCTVTVVNRATGIELDHNRATLVIDGTNFGEQRLVATVSPPDAVNRNVVWTSSDESIATVISYGGHNQYAIVRAENRGEATITATIAGTELSATCDVYVDVFPTGITLNYTSRILTLNNPARNSVSLEATIDSPADQNDTIVWRSDDSSIATVDSNGVVRAAGLGTTFIWATVAGGSSIFAVAQITVVYEVRGISLPDEVTLEIDGDEFESKTLDITFDPLTATDRRVTWVSSDESIVTVDVHGTITARHPGEARITATSVDGGHEASTLVTVISRVTHVLVNEREMFLVIDGNDFGYEQLNWTVLPENATNPDVEFGDYNATIIHVSEAGVVTARRPGITQVTIRAVDNGITAETRVTVIVRAVGIRISPQAHRMTAANTAVTDTYQLRAIVDPEYATSPVTWVSSNENIVRVEQDGRIYGVRPGTVMITAIVDGRSAHATITVEPEILLKTDFNNVFVNGNVVSQTMPGAIIAGNAGMMPIRTLIDALDGASFWESANTARVHMAGRVFNFQVGRETMFWRYADETGFRTVELPAAPRFIEGYPGRLYVPIRPLMQVLGWSVHWHSTDVRGESYIFLSRLGFSENDPRVRQKIEHGRGPSGLNIQQITSVTLHAGRTMVPARSLLDTLASGYEWISSTQTLRMFISGHIFNFAVDRGAMYWSRDGVAGFTTVSIDSRPFIVGERMQIPVHYMATVLGWGNYGNFLQSVGVEVNARRYLTLTHDVSRALTATVLPNIPNIESNWREWESSNPNIVSVNRTTGQITTRGIGAATITVTNGRGHTDSIVVRVILTAPQSLRHSDVTHNTARLQWNAVSGAAYYRIERQRYGGSWQYSGTVAAPQTYHIARNLAPNTHYTFRVIAQRASVRNSTWDSRSSTTIFFYTRLEPVDPWVDNITQNTARINWRGVAGGRYYRVEQLVNGVWQHRITTTAGHFDASGLTANTLHQFRIISQRTHERDSARDSIPANITFWTRLARPTVTSTSAAHNSVTVNWNAVSGAQFYHIQRWNGTAWVYGTTVGGTQGSGTVSNLASGTTHWFRVIAQQNWDRNNPRNSFPSDQVSRLTRPAAPNQPSASGITQTSVTLSWNTPTSATHFSLYRGTTRIRTNITGTSATVTGLAAGTTYTFRVRAYNASGGGPQSTGRTVTTLGAPVPPPPTNPPTPPPGGFDGVELLTQAQVQALGRRPPGNSDWQRVPLTDLRTGQTFMIYWSHNRSDHTDWSPANAAAVRSIQGILNPSGANRDWLLPSSWSWSARPGVVEVVDSAGRTRSITVGFHLFPHGSIVGYARATEISPLRNMSNTRPSGGWPVGGHMCMYYSNSTGGTSGMNEAARNAHDHLVNGAPLR